VLGPGGGGRLRADCGRGGAVAGGPSPGIGKAPEALGAARAAREAPSARESEGRRLGKVGGVGGGSRAGPGEG